MSCDSSPRLTLNLKVMSCENRGDKVDNGEPRPFTSHSTAFLRPPRQSLRYSLRSPRFAPLRGEWNGVSEAWRVVRQGATIRLLTQLVSLAYTYRNEPG